MKIMKLLYYIIAVILILFSLSIDAKNDGNITIKFDSEYVTKQKAYRGIEDEIITVNFSISYTVKLNITKIELKCKLDDTYVADFVNWTSMMLDVKKNVSMLKSIGILIVLRHLGLSTLFCGLIDPRDNYVELIEIYQIIVQRLPTLIELIFQISATVAIIIIFFVMGCGLDRVVILNYIKRPIAPGIGFGCQYLIMPFLSFGIATLTGINKNFGLGLLLVGCSPGGGTSNIWTVLLRGDMNLSMVMTFLSTVAALFMMPFWLFALGRYFVDPKYVEIPYGRVAVNLLQIVLPVGLGMLCRYKFDKIADWIANKVDFVGSIVVIFFLIFGIIANYYVFLLIGQYLYLIPICASLPWLGFIFGGFFAYITKRNFNQIVTISIETGLQNVGIPFLILKYSIPQPFGDIAASVPLIIGMVTPIPLYIIWFVIIIYGKFKKQPINNEKKVENKNDDIKIPLQSDVTSIYDSYSLQNEIIVPHEDVNLKNPSKLSEKSKKIEEVIDEYFRVYSENSTK